MKEDIVFNKEARERLSRGVTKLTNAVKSTLGPGGRTVIIQKHDELSITKDGVSVAEKVFLTDPVENMGAQIVKEVASKTAASAGDGTTTATLLADGILSWGMKHVLNGRNPTELKKGIDKGVELVVEVLKSKAQKVSSNLEIEQVATVSANGDNEIGKLIARAVDKLGKDGVITVNESDTPNTEIEIVKGMRFDNGYVSPYLLREDENDRIELTKPSIIIYDKVLTNMKTIIPILEKLMAANQPALIIAEDIKGEVLKTLILNRYNEKLNIVAVRAPGFGGRKPLLMGDIATLTGGKVIGGATNTRLEDASLKDLGSAESIVITRNDTTIVSGLGDADTINEKVTNLKKSLDFAQSEFEKGMIKDRIASLTSGIAVINVGASSKVEMKEKKDRVDDAVQATKSAMEEGIISGGGTAYLYAFKVLDKYIADTEDVQAGVDIVKEVIFYPLEQILKNAGIESSPVINKIVDSKYTIGYNVRTESYENLIDSGIIDPVKVSRVALQNASSVAGTLLTTECIVM